MRQHQIETCDNIKIKTCDNIKLRTCNLNKQNFWGQLNKNKFRHMTTTKTNKKRYWET